MSKQLIALLVLMPAVAAAQTLTRSAPVVVNAGADVQEDPHVSGSYVAYTNWDGGARINYYHFPSGSNAVVPNSTTGYDFLSDINGSTLVFIRVADYAGVYVYDVVTGAGPTEVDPNAAADRMGAAIGGGTIAWQETSAGTTDIVVHQLAANRSTRLTADATVDRDAAVAASGNVVSWTRCSGTGCDIYKAALDGSGNWVVSPVTGAEGSESFSDTNGAVVVYDSLRGSEKDIFWKGSDGIEHQLALAGEQKNPSISGNLIAFESIDRSVAGANWDILLHDLATGTTYALADSSANETLNDVWSSGADGTVAYTVGGADVYATHFSISRPPPPPTSCDQKRTSCEDPGSRALLATVSVTRGTGEPQTASAAFEATGEGLVCVTNAGATAGWVSVNDAVVVKSDQFKKRVQDIQKKVTLTGSNLLEARIAGKKGSSYAVAVYGPANECEDEDDDEGDDDGHDDDDGDDDDGDDHRDHRRGHHGGISKSSFTSAAVVDPGALASGCSSTGGNSMVMAVLALAGLALLRPRRACAKVRRTRD